MTRSAPRMPELEQAADRAPRHSVQRQVQVSPRERETPHGALPENLASRSPTMINTTSAMPR
jgi:hypothetical protein